MCCADAAGDQGRPGLIRVIARFGRRFPFRIRIELRIRFFRTNLDLEGDQTALSFLANVYYDIPTTSRFTQFLTAGIGFVMADDLEFSDGSTLDGPSTHNIYLGMRYTF